MQNNPIEDQLRKQLSQHLTPIDVDALWDKVEPRLPKKKHRVLPFWIWLVAGLLLSGSLLLRLPDEDNISRLALASRTPSPAALTETPAPLPGGDVATPALKSPVTTTHSTATDDLIPKSAPAVNVSLPSLPPKSKTPAPAPSAAVMEQAPPMVYAKTETLGLEISPRRHTLTVDASDRSGDITQPEPILFVAEQITLRKSCAVVDPAPMNAPAAPPITEVKPEVGAIIATPEKTIADTDRKAEQELRTTKKILVQKPDYWTIEPGIALSLPSRSSSVEDSPGSEKALEGISLQGLVGYHRASGLSVRTGLIMSRINSKLQAEIIRLGSQPQEAVVIIIENANGVNNEQLGTIQLATAETTTSEYYNSVNSMDIPLLIGYRFSGNKWGLMVEAGPTFNLSCGGQAHRYNGTSFAAVGGNYFRQKLEDQGFLANFGGTYGLTEKTSLTANLRFQRFGNGGFENPDLSSSSTNYSLFGIQIGYRIRF